MVLNVSMIYDERPGLTVMAVIISGIHRVEDYCFGPA